MAARRFPTFAFAPVALLLVALGVGLAPLACCDEEPETGVARGRVLDIEGHPIAGASVGYLVAQDGWSCGFDKVPGPRPTVRTSKEGTYEIPHHPNDRWLTADAPGYCRVEVGLQTHGPPGDVVLVRPRGRASGRIRDGAARPVAGARVRAHWSWGDKAWTTETISGEDGLFDMPLPPGHAARLRLGVLGDGYWPLTSAVRPRDEEGIARQDLVLERNAPITGVVVDAQTGAPLEDATVDLGGSPPSAVSTDSGGRFSIVRWHKHQESVRARAKGYAAETLECPLGTNRPLGIALRADPGGTSHPASSAVPPPPKYVLTGIVLNEEGHPVKGALVGFSSTRTGGWRPLPPRVRTDAEGLFRLEGVMPGHFVVQAHRPNEVVFGESRIAIDARRAPDPVDIRIPSGYTLTGRVVEADEIPVEGVHVTATACDAPGRSRTTTDGEGRFTLPGVCEFHIQLSLRRPGYRAWDSPFVVAGVLAHPLRIDRRTPGPSRGAEDVPQGPRIRFTGLVPPDGTRVPFRYGTGGGGGGGNHLYVWDGESRLWATRTATYTFHAPGYVAGPIEIEDVENPDDAPPIEIPMSAGLRIAGIVRRTNGTPVAGVKVHVSDGSHQVRDPRWMRMRTDEDGRFLIDGLEPGRPLTLRVCAKGYAYLSRDVPRGTEDLVFELSRAGRINGRVEPVEGETLPREGRLEVRREGRAEAWSRNFDKTTGAFALQGLEPGRYELTAQIVKAARGDPVFIDVVGGEAVEGVVLVAPPRGLVIEGRVISREGLPLKYAEVFVTGECEAPPPTRRVRIDRDGRFEVCALPPGRYTVEVEPRSRPWRRRRTVFCPARVAGVEAGREPIEIVMSRGGRIVGRVVPRPGRQLGSCHITLAPELRFGRLPFAPPPPPRPSGRRREVATGTGSWLQGGRFVLENVPPGAHRLFVAETEVRRGYLLGIGCSGDLIEVGEEETKRGVTLALREPTRLQVTVVETDGTPAENAVLRFENEVWGRFEEPARGTRQPIFVWGLAPGRWTLRARRPDETTFSDPIEVDLLERETVPVEVRLPPS